MSRLRQLQVNFQNYLTGINEDIENDIVSTADALAEHRLGAYYNAYRARLIDILAIDYSAIEKHLGRDAFENLALDYLKQYPSTQPSARWFGQDFPEYIRKYCKRDDTEFLAELASFEWTQGLVFDAEDSDTIFTIDDMAEVPPEAWTNLTIKFIPALRWLDLHWNVSPYSVAVNNDKSLPEPHRDEIPLRWLIWRKSQNPNWRSLDVHEAWAIETTHQGGSFSELCEGLCEWISEDQVAITAAGFLKQWINDELVTGIKY